MKERVWLQTGLCRNISLVILEREINNKLFIIPRWPHTNQMDNYLFKKLESNGICCSEYYNPEGELCWILRPKDLKYVSILAPLYIFDCGRYMQIQKEYRSEAIDPEQYNIVENIVETCRNEVKTEKSAQFNQIFLKSSLDNGITSLIDVTYNDNSKCGFFSMYIPEGYIQVCDFKPLFGLDIMQTLYIKKFNKKLKHVTIKIPTTFKKYIQANPKILRSLAKQLNVNNIVVT